MTRPSWDLYFLRLAYVTAERASCTRKKVGALIVRDADKRIISGGYNGAPRGMPDCFEVGCDLRDIDGKQSCVRTIHAESNALDLAGSVILTPHTIYTTVIPCRNCALRIIQAGIKRCVYHEYYVSQGTNEVVDLFSRKDLDLPVGLTPVPRVELVKLDLPMTVVRPVFLPLEDPTRE